MTLFFHITIVNVKVLTSFTGKNDFVLRDASVRRLAERSDKFETIKFYRTQISCKIDFAKYPFVIYLLRHKS